MNNFLTGFFDGFVYLVEAILERKVAITALIFLVMSVVGVFASNLSNPSKVQRSGM